MPLPSPESSGGGAPREKKPRQSGPVSATPLSHQPYSDPERAQPRWTPPPPPKPLEPWQNLSYQGPKPAPGEPVAAPGGIGTSWMHTILASAPRPPEEPKPEAKPAPDQLNEWIDRQLDEGNDSPMFNPDKTYGHGFKVNDPYKNPRGGPSYGHLLEQRIADRKQLRIEEGQKLEKEQSLKEGTSRSDPKADTRRLTWERYLKLDENQRAAVDANTEIWNSLQRDLKLQDTKLTEEEAKAYNDLVVQVTGGEGLGSTKYSPNLVATLDSLGYTDAGDLDTWISGKRMLTGNDLRALRTYDATPAVQPNRTSPVSDARYAMQAEFASKAAEKIDQVMAESPAIMQSLQQYLRSDRNATLAAIGGTAYELKQTMPGFGEAKTNADGTMNTDGFFQTSFNALANAELEGEQYQQVLGQIMGQMDGETRKQFMHFADVRSRQALDYGTALGTDPEGKYKDAAGFRAALGLE